MMSKRTVWLCLVGAVFALATSASVAQADPFALQGPVNGGDQLQLKYNDFEVVANTTGNALYGVFFVSSIVDQTTGRTVWAEGFNGQGQIAGFFNNYISQGATPNSNGTFTVNFTAGDVNMFYDPAVIHTLAGSRGTNAAPDNNGTWTAGSLFLSMTGTPGIVPADPTVTLNSTINSTTAPISGTGFGYLHVTGGLFSSYVLPGGAPPAGSSPAPPGADALLQSNIKTKPASETNNPWDIDSFDPVTFTVVPEPASIALFGVGAVSLLGLARKARRRKVVD